MTKRVEGLADEFRESAYENEGNHGAVAAFVLCADRLEEALAADRAEAGELPELPEPVGVTQLGSRRYTELQMLAYGQQCARAASCGGGEVYGYEHNGGFWFAKDATPWVIHHATKLYTTPPTPSAGVEVTDRRALVWLAGKDSSMPSIAIVHHMLGMESDGSFPWDPWDLGRCLRMLELFPEWKPRIGEMARYSEQWARISAKWDELAAMMADEVGIDWSKGKKAPKTYAALTAALEGGK